jgi:hypothetical protein
VLTNDQGYYRYRMGDMVTFTKTDPYTVTGVSRKGRVVNLSGEKISEAHVSNAMKAACIKTSAEIMDYTVVGTVENGLGNYVIAAMFHDENVDPVEFVHAFEDSLGQTNLEFRFNRETGALGPTTLLRMRSSHFEDIVRSSHLQAKPTPLTTDTAVLAVCEAF